jgi:hypothetical protein
MMKEPRETVLRPYAKPEVRTTTAAEILEALGPALCVVYEPPTEFPT